MKPWQLYTDRYMGPIISIDTYRHWEIVRYLDSQNPGRNGYFTAEDAK